MRTNIEEIIADIVGCYYPSRASYTTATKRAYDRLKIATVQATYDDGGNCQLCGECGRCPGWHVNPHITPHPTITAAQHQYAAKQAAFDYRFFTLEATLKDQLKAGHIIDEVIGDRTIPWSPHQTPYASTWENRTPDWVAAHLTARHRGFATVLSSRCQ